MILKYMGGCVLVMCKYYAILSKGLEHAQTWIPIVGLETNPLQVLRDDHTV